MTETGKKKIIADALRYALSKGADQCEIYVSESRSESTQMRDGTLSDDQTSSRSGFSVRLIRGGVPGFSYGVRLEKEPLRRAVDDALLSCDFLDPDEDYHFTAAGKAYPDVPAVKSAPVSVAEKKAVLAAMTAAAAKDDRIRRVERTSVSEYGGSTLLMNTLGLDLYKESRFVSVSAAVVAEADGDEQIGGDFQAAPSLDRIDCEGVASRAAADGIEKLGAAPTDTGEYPVLFHPDAALSLLSLLLPSFLGDRAEKGLSVLKDRVGERIAAKGVFLYDDALMAETVVPSPFDDEGQPCRRNALLEDGVLKGFLYNNTYASRAGRESTGNGLCGSHKTLPSVGLNSYYLKKGDIPPEKVIGAVSDGVWIKDLMGLHMADPVSGDFSLGVIGRRIRGGEPAEGIRGSMAAGNLFDLLQNIEAVCDDFTVVGDVGAPSFLIKSLKISGK